MKWSECLRRFEAFPGARLVANRFFDESGTPCAVSAIVPEILACVPCGDSLPFERIAAEAGIEEGQLDEIIRENNRYYGAENPRERHRRIHRWLKMKVFDEETRNDQGGK